MKKFASPESRARSSSSKGAGGAAGRPVRRRAPGLPPEERRKQLLECAVRVFARQGIGAAGHADVAAEAGVAVPTVFSYFPNRQALVRSVVLEVDRFLSEMIESVVAEHRGASNTLLAVIRLFADCVERYPDPLRLWLNWSTAVQSAVWPLYEAFQNRVIATFEKIVRAGQASGELDPEIDPAAAAYLVVASGHMIVQMQFTKCDPGRVQRYLETVIHGALNNAAVGEMDRADLATEK